VLEAASGVYGELQAGSFMFMDADYAQRARPGTAAFEHALFVKTQVISTCATHAVCDAGHKSHAIDSGLPRVHAFDGAASWSTSTAATSTACCAPAGGQPGRLPALGRYLWLVPGHCDPTVNLHDFMIGVRGGLRSGRGRTHHQG
jgi:D-serine deaminase-like pyridoxal phosphate-dependent protein